MDVICVQTVRQYVDNIEDMCAVELTYTELSYSAQDKPNGTR